MRTAQALAVISAVGGELGADIDLRLLSNPRRRRTPSCQSVRDLAQLIIEFGREQHLSFRQLSEGDNGSNPGAPLPLPLVVLRAAGSDDFLAHIVRGEKGDSLDVVTITNGGVGREERLPRQLLTDGSGTVLLVPVFLPPMVSSPTRHEEGDGRHSGGAAGHDDADPVGAVARLGQLLRFERRLIAYTLLYASLAGLFSLTLPLGVQAIVGLVSGGMLLQPVVILIAFVVLGTFAQGGLQILQLSVVEKIQQRTFTRFAFELGTTVPRLRLDALSDVDLPEQMNRFFEIKTIQKTLAKLLTDWSAAVLQLIFGIVLLVFYHPYFSLFGILLVASLALFFRLTSRQGMTTSFRESKYTYRVAHWLEEMARNLRVLKFAGTSQMGLERMDDEVSSYLTWRRAHFRILVQQSWAFVAFKTLVTGSVLVLGSLLVVDRSISLGQFVAAELVIVTVLLSIEKLILGLADGYDLLTAVEKAGHLTDFPTERDGGIAPAPRAHGLALDVRALSFSYQGGSTPALENVSLSIASGESIAITGAEGAGESTLLQVVGGLYEQYDGAIAYDGVSLRELDRARVRETVGFCSDSLELFEGTIEENVSLGRAHVRTEDVLEALGAVGLQEWTQLQGEGLQTQILGEGRSLPSQVARKLQLARALAGNPRLLLLDDFLDNLDPLAKRELIPMLLAPNAKWTVLVVTHDAQVMAACDRIVVLRDGSVETTGSLESLQQHPYFRDLTAA